MGKRFLISLMMIILVVGSIMLGASLFFSNRYETLENQNALSEQQEDLLTILENQTSPDSEISSDEPLVPAPELSSAPLSSSDASAVRASLLVEDMTLEEKICQMLFVTQEALTGYNRVTQSGAVTKSALEQYPVGGIIYFSSNLVTTDQTKEMIQNIQSYSRELTGRGLFIGVDEEGGSVARVAESLGTTAFEDMSVYGEAEDTESAYNIGATQAQELSALGFNVNFSPVADVLTNEQNNVVQTRSFGSDPELVSSMVSQVVRGLTDGGMLCAPKHFPGHGSTGGDTHDGFAASSRTIEELEACDLLPFQAAIDAGAPMIMVGHMTMTEIDDENPASMSSTIIKGILRDQMNYDGIVITDALDMSAITNQYTNAEAAVQAISAGCDMLLCVSNLHSVVTAVTNAVENGIISESQIDASVVRILTAKLRYGIMS